MACKVCSVTDSVVGPRALSRLTRRARWSVRSPDQIDAALACHIRPDQRIPALLVQLSGVVGPAATRVAPDGANVDNAGAHRQVGGAFQP